MDDSVGVRELRQHLSRYLERVRRGETLQVVSRGRPVAVLAPLPANADPVDRLVAEGRVRRASGRVAALGPVPGTVASDDRPISNALDELRDDG